MSSQPDLNFHNPQVRQAVLDELRFWLQRGIDGVRLDAINFCFHDQQLRDNPPKPVDKRVGRGFLPDNPYAYQYHLYNNTRPENLQFLEDLRVLIDQYPGAVALGEISAEDSNATMAEYTGPGRLHTGYSFELLSTERTPAHIRATVEGVLAASAEAWPCWSISNHDVKRVRTRWGDEHSPVHLTTQFTAMVCSLRGAVSIYQGEELGLPEAEVPFEALRDPYGRNFWPNFKGRDGCRTPMPWTPQPHAGFTSGTPWLPIPADHLELSVSSQESDPTSTLNAFRRLMRWRKQHPALLWGSIEFQSAGDAVLAFTRQFADERLLVAFNLSPAAVKVEIPNISPGELISGHGLPEGRFEGTGVSIPAHGVIVCRMTGNARGAAPAGGS